MTTDVDRPAEYDAVLVVSFGGPDDVLPFLENVLRGRNVPRERMLEVAEHYQHFGGKSPINEQNLALIAALREELERRGPRLPVYWGNPVSEHAERHLDLMGIGNLLALTPHNELNALAAQYYRMEFEPRNIFTVRTHCPERVTAEEKCSYKFGGRQFPNRELTFTELADMLGKGAVVKTTTLTEEFTWDKYRSQQGERRLPLLAVTPAGSVIVFNADAEFTPKSGWKIIGLAEPATS